MRKVIVLLLTVLLLTSLATVAFATEDGQSEVTKPGYKVEVIYDFDVEESGGVTIVQENEEYTLSPKEKEGYEFEGYEITGEYELVSQDGSTWVIIPHSDLVIHVKYKETKPNPNPHDDEPVSPPTGDNAALYTAMILIGLFGVVLSVKKLVKTH